MSYSVEADLNLSQERLVELTETNAAVGVKDADLIARLQARATAKIDAALFGKYATPVEEPPAILTEVEADLWRYYLYTHREVMDVPKSVADDYAEALALLKEYKEGAAFLNAPLASSVSGDSPRSGSFSSDCDERAFGRAKDWL